MCGFHCTCPVCWATDWMSPEEEELYQEAMAGVESFNLNEEELPLLPPAILACLDAIKAL